MCWKMPQAPEDELRALARKPDSCSAIRSAWRVLTSYFLVTHLMVFTTSTFDQFALLRVWKRHSVEVLPSALAGGTGWAPICPTLRVATTATAIRTRFILHAPFQSEGLASLHRQAPYY